MTANPDGTFTQDISASPQRVQKDGSWIPLDPTLHRNTDGTYSTAATSATLTLSGGGTVPLAAMDDAGKQLAFSWPTLLPTPTVTGSTALYTNVLPDVDLSVQADAQGGFSDTIIVKTAQGAQNPALQTLNLATTSTGVTLSADSAGNLSATDDNGTLIFHAPAPVMWDSTNSANTPQSLKGGALATETEASPADDGPASGAQVAPVAVRVADNSVQLTPSASLLNSADTTFPVYIDPDTTPTWIYGSRNSADYTYIQSGHAGTSNFDANTTYDSQGTGVGYQGYESPTGIERSIYQFNVGTALDSKIIHNAVLSLDETFVASLGCETHAVQAYSTAPHIDSGTTWNNYSGATANFLDTQYIGGAYNTGCAGATPTTFDVTPAVTADGDGTITLELRGDENTSAAFKRFAKTAKLSYLYDTAPSIPDHIGSTPIPQDAPGQPNYGCNTTGDWGWISNGGSGGNVILSGVISDPDATNGVSNDQVLYGQFALWDADGTDLIVMGAAANPSAGTLDSNADTNWQASGSTALKRVPVSKLINGHTYGYELRGNDGLAVSAPSYSCHFRYDAQAPTGVSINGTGTTGGSCTDGGTLAQAGTADHLTLRATDSGSGLDHFDWTLGAASDLAGDGGTHLSSAGALTITPTSWGSYFLNIAAVDQAGNESGAVCYSFYIPDNPSAHVTPGDINGVDGLPDIAGVPAAGSYPSNPGLRYYTTNTTSPAGAIASNSTDGPNTDGSWTGAITAHRSTLQRSASGTKTDDLWALGTNHQLYLYFNNFNTLVGTAGHDNQYYSADNRATFTRPVCSTTVTTCTGYASNWSSVRQLLAPGDMNDDGLPDLVTEETGNQLWFFPGTSTSGQLGTPQLLGSSGWDSSTVITPGNTPADNGLAPLWARNNTTGSLSSYATTLNTTTGKVALATPTQIGANYPASTYPLIISVGDISGGGAPDLIAVTTTGSLVDQLGSTTPSTTEFDGTAGKPATIATGGWDQLSNIS
ncbi:hypothetical protein ACFO3J_12720 [Streptomyces polygonati]|uniref:Uncharacterized protein n=1 Tax=Streptomyces polygonati TaxID=1617087 RepID=A0ABV8HN65_9ACTN